MNSSRFLFNLNFFISRIIICFVIFPLFVKAGPLFVPEPMLEQALAKSLRVERDSLTTELVAEKLEYFELIMPDFEI